MPAARPDLTARAAPPRAPVAAALLLCAAVAGCAAGPVPQPAATVAATPPAAETVAEQPARPAWLDEAARRARAQVGRPYRFGGAGPEAFDCSGLVRYAFEGSGLAVPRTAEEQRAWTEPVDEAALAPGDLVFFRLPDPHVGVYLGEGEFVHAPGAGRSVTIARLDEPWFILAYAGAGRVPQAAAPASSSPAAAAPAP